MLESQRKSYEPTILTGMSVRDRLSSMIADKRKLNDLDIVQGVCETSMAKFYKKISDLSQRDSGSKFNLNSVQNKNCQNDVQGSISQKPDKKLDCQER